MAYTRSPDETGKTYGHLQVEMRLPTKHGKAIWQCYCTACDSPHKASGADLRSGAATHCGCLTARARPTVISLAARVAALEELLERLRAEGVPLTAAATGPAQPPAPTPAPTSGLEDHSHLGWGIKNPVLPISRPIIKPKDAPSLEQADAAMAELQAIVDTPFEQREKDREKIEEVRRHMRDLIKILGDYVKAYVGGDIFKDGDAHAKPRHDKLTEFVRAAKHYHINPRDL